MSNVPRAVKEAREAAITFSQVATRAINDFESNDLAYLTGTKTTAELKRRSMDLTRALAEMRKGWLL